MPAFLLELICTTPAPNAPPSPYARLVKSARLNCTWFQPSSSRMGMVQMKGFTRVVDCRGSAGGGRGFRGTEQVPHRNGRAWGAAATG